MKREMTIIRDEYVIDSVDIVPTDDGVILFLDHAEHCWGDCRSFTLSLTNRQAKTLSEFLKEAVQVEDMAQPGNGNCVHCDKEYDDEPADRE